jgi:putative mRNA 3-end processing factor
MLGSAQVRLQYRGRIEVVTGDYKLGQDPTCASWEPVKCHRLVSESTFGLPVYRWPSTEEIFGEINSWWRANAAEGRCSVLYGYAVGKSQRLLAGLDDTIGPVFTHGAVEKGCQAYRQSGIRLPATEHVAVAEERKQTWQGAMILAVPSTHGTSWLRRFGKIRTAMASGWMMIRGNRRRRNVDRGFVLSDHVDWSSLIEAVRLCEPESVWVTHGYTATVARYLCELGYDALAIGHAERVEEE